MTIRAVTPSPVNLLVLASLYEAPMHPYEIHRVAIEREKVSALGIKRGSLYHAVQRLEEAGLIEPAETSRDGRRPERTVYRLTAVGREDLVTWLVTMLRRPSNDVPDFLSALEFLPVLDPQEVQNSLDHRVVQLDRELGGMRAGLASIGDRLPRVFTIENEYGIAMKQAERDWSAAIAEELRAGGLTWSYDELIEWAKTSPFSLVTRSHD